MHICFAHPLGPGVPALLIQNLGNGKFQVTAQSLRVTPIMLVQNVNTREDEMYILLSK